MLALTPVVVALALIAGGAAPTPKPGNSAKPTKAAKPAAAKPTPSVSALVKKCIEAYGGAKAVTRLARVRHEGKVTSEVLHPGQPGRISRSYQRTGKLRVEIAYPGAPVETRVLDGEKGWRFGEEVEGPFLVSMILQAARLDLPALLAAWESKVVDGGTVQHEGKTLRVLTLEIAPSVVVEAAIDPNTGRILISQGMGLGAMPVQFVTTYSDFRKVDGVLVPFHEWNWANGKATGETFIEKVEFVREFPDTTFQNR